MKVTLWFAKLFGVTSTNHSFLQVSLQSKVRTILSSAISLFAANGDRTLTDHNFMSTRGSKKNRAFVDTRRSPSPLFFSTRSRKEQLAAHVKSVNYHISRQCNYACKFCFHTQKNVDKLSLDQACRGLELLRQAGVEKINFAGGEPFLHRKLLGELCKHSFSLGMAVSIISNGSLITPQWIKEYGYYVDVLGVSIDSFDPVTNAEIGRGGDANRNKHVKRVLQVRELCAQHGIFFKMNTVICSLNWREDMTAYVERLEPYRWKVFQVLILHDENSGRSGELRDARPLKITNDQYMSFIRRHQENKFLNRILVPESNQAMQNSYLLLDEKLRFLDSSGGGKVPSESILDVGVEKALQQSGFDYEMFVQRGGIYDWKRNRRSGEHHNSSN